VGHAGGFLFGYSMPLPFGSTNKETNILLIVCKISGGISKNGNIRCSIYTTNVVY
jgi:hypothetical protein